jgi:hypothetical protein
MSPPCTRSPAAGWVSAIAARAPTGHRPTARQSASFAPCSLAGPTVRSTAQAKNGQRRLTAGSGTTTIDADTQPSVTNPRSAGPTCSGLTARRASGGPSLSCWTALSVYEASSRRYRRSHIFRAERRGERQPFVGQDNAARTGSIHSLGPNRRLSSLDRRTSGPYVSAIQRVASRSGLQPHQPGQGCQWGSSLPPPSQRGTLNRRLPTCQTQVAHDGSKAVRDTIETYVRGYTQFLASPRLCGGRRAFSGAGGAQIRQRP